MHLAERLSRIADLGATWILWLLVALSVATLAVVVERAVFLLASRVDGERLRDELRALLARGDVPGARRALEQSRALEARVAAAGLDGDGPAAAEERMAGESELARLALEQNLSLLGTLGANAPFVGLLGTVVGIVRAFRELEGAGGRPSAGLMSEIGEALVATAVGLLVALPAVAAYNLFQRVVRARLGAASALSHEVLAHLRAPRLAGGGE